MEIWLNLESIDLCSHKELCLAVSRLKRTTPIVYRDPALSEVGVAETAGLVLAGGCFHESRSRRAAVTCTGPGRIARLTYGYERVVE